MILRKAFPLLCPLTPAISAYIIGRFQCHEDLAIRDHQQNQQTLEKEHLVEIKKYESNIMNWTRYLSILKVFTIFSNYIVASRPFILWLVLRAQQYGNCKVVPGEIF